VECSIRLNKHTYSLTEFVNQSLEEHHWAITAQIFLKAWLNGDDTFSMQTSGSTGHPKTILLSRSQMIASAEATIETLSIPKGTKALLCINTDYIGGKMMLVRAILGKWALDLIEPSMDPSIQAQREAYDFAALVPLQLLGLTKHKNGKVLLNNITQVIIGGAPIPDELLSKVHQLENKCYHTYGMTETVSHIGLKKLNGTDASDWFDIVKGNEITQDARSCLRVKGAVTNNEWVQTNDLIELRENRFKWLGRADLIVNSGGVKILIEKAEKDLTDLLPTELKGQFIYWKKADKSLGEKLVGIALDRSFVDYIEANKSVLIQNLPPYTLPKEWLVSLQFVFTESGKLDRPNTYKRLPNP